MGEAKSAPLEILEETRKNLHEIIKDYDLNNVFNYDETGLYWDLEPSKTIMQNPLSGKKKSKKHVTLLLTCNATGTEKLKPLFIHTYQNSQILRGKKERFTNENVNLTNVAVHFLPPNTAHLQPYDAGIINSFKAQYRKVLVRNRIEAYEILQELRKDVTPLNIYDAINFSKSAWDSIHSTPKCWQYTGILSQDEMNDIIEDYDEQAIRDEMEIQELINQLPFDDPMDAVDFLHIDDSLKGIEGLTDDEIVSMVKSKNKEPKTDPNEGSLEVISTKEALGRLDDLVLFFEYSSNISINPDELNILKKLRRRVLTLHINNAKQATLDSFIQ
ncbi:CENP-B homolog protein 2-like [Rhizophagus clarus]|uniref:CENP-B homolog protein 2-like n=1 Tax=Rhizophagus clarus TaxID=94130 RepID=A0A8H3QPX3_9GLOM|nr:CENP-B homolog protein 2-like [Rhizophagus clarus]